MRIMCACVVGACSVAWAGDPPLIGGNVAGNQLVSMDKTTAMTTLLTSMQVQPNGLAYHNGSNRMYAVDAGPESVYEIDMKTGAATLIAPLPDENWNGLAVEASTGMIFVSSIEGDERLFKIDPDTGAVTPVGVFVGAKDVEGLAFDSSTDTLYGVDDLSNQLVVIDQDTAAATAVLALPAANWRGLTYDPSLHALFASVSVSGSLYRIDLDGGPSLTEIGTIFPAGGVQGLAVVGTGGDDCYPDFNGDGSLDVLDFVAFQGAFINGDPEADCNEDGKLNVLDFVCFQASFQKGCD